MRKYSDLPSKHISGLADAGPELRSPEHLLLPHTVSQSPGATSHTAFPLESVCARAGLWCEVD